MRHSVGSQFSSHHYPAGAQRVNRTMQRMRNDKICLLLCKGAAQRQNACMAHIKTLKSIPSTTQETQSTNEYSCQTYVDLNFLIIFSKQQRREHLDSIIIHVSYTQRCIHLLQQTFHLQHRSRKQDTNLMLLQHL